MEAYWTVYLNTYDKNKVSLYQLHDFLLLVVVHIIKTASIIAASCNIEHYIIDIEKYSPIYRGARVPSKHNFMLVPSPAKCDGKPENPA